MYNEYNIYNKYCDMHDIKKDKKQKDIDLLKVLIVLIAASSNFISLFSNEEYLKIENVLTILYIITLVRIIIVSFSLIYNWPILVCSSITIVISVLSLLYFKSLDAMLAS